MNNFQALNFTSSKDAFYYGKIIGALEAFNTLQDHEKQDESWELRSCNHEEQDEAKSGDEDRHNEPAVEEEEVDLAIKSEDYEASSEEKEGLVNPNHEDIRNSERHGTKELALEGHQNIKRIIEKKGQYRYFAECGVKDCKHRP